MKAKILALFAAVVLPIGAMAAPINGTIDITGDVDPTVGGVATGNLAIADGLHFPVDGDVVDTSGDFSGIANCSMCVTRNDIDLFAPLTLTNPLWSVGGFSFALETLSVDFQNAMFLNLSGSGTVSGAGFDPTPGNWALSVQGVSMEFSFSSTTDTRPPVIPEPSIPALFGIGLLVAGLARRARR